MNIDHRRGAAYAPGDLISYVRAGWDLGQNIRTHIEVVHRLNNLGAVVTHAAHGTSQEGFNAEWRGVQILTVEGDVINRSELFDEPDLDDALARFEQLSRPIPRLENAASRVYERFMATFAARDWDAMAQLLANDASTDDRRRVVNSGIQDGREANIATMRAFADLGVTHMTSEVIATRGECLALSRVGSAAFQTYVLNIVEIDADELIVAVVGLDVSDIDAAFAELDARYLAGEAAAHAHIWSLVAGAYAAVNRHELPATTPDWAMVDHRPIGTFEAADLAAFLDATWTLTTQASIYIEAVHRLNDLGAVVTHASHATSQEGLDVEWHDINLVTVDGDLVASCEIFDAADLDTALAKFEALHPTTPQLKNAASQVAKRFWGCFVARNRDAMAALIADNVATEDRRRVVSAGSWHGRDFDIASMRATADIGVSNATLTVIATRGNRLALSRVRLSGRDQRPEAFHTEALSIAEIDADGRLVAHVAFDPDDFDTAFAELDARYLAGEAAAHSQTWSVFAKAYAGFSRKELPPTTPDWVNIDRRPLVTIEAGSLKEYLRATMDATSRFNMQIAAVHRLSDLGAVVTHTTHATSHEGLDAEWQDINLMTVDGDLINRCEIFDEADIDAALARFDELHTAGTTTGKHCKPSG